MAELTDTSQEELEVIDLESQLDNELMCIEEDAKADWRVWCPAPGCTHRVYSCDWHFKTKMVPELLRSALGLNEIQCRICGYVGDPSYERI